MTGLKDTYKSREEDSLGRTGQLRMEVNAVTNTGQSAPVTQSAQGNQIIRIEECEDKLNHLGNCYGCNKPGHVLRDCMEKKNNHNSFRNNYIKGTRIDSRDPTCYNCDKKGHFA